MKTCLIFYDMKRIEDDDMIIEMSQMMVTIIVEQVECIIAAKSKE